MFEVRKSVVSCQLSVVGLKEADHGPRTTDNGQRANSAFRIPHSAITLTEVLISMGILTLGLLGVAAMFPVGSYYMQKGDTADRASAVAQAAFNDAVTQGLLDPKNWYGLVPGSSTTAGAANRGFSADGGAAVNTFRRPFAAALNEAISFASSQTYPQKVLSQQMGNAYVLDPMGVAGATFNDYGYNFILYPVPATAYSDSVSASAYAPTQWAAWKNSTAPDYAWPIRRVTFHQPNLDPSILSATVPLKAAVAERLFGSHDDLSIDLPDRDDMPSTQNWNVVYDSSGTPSSVARQSRGDYSWFITVVPKTADARNALASGGSGQAYDVSVVVFYKRVLPRTDPVDKTASKEAATRYTVQERVVRAQVLSTGPSGGELLLTAYDGVGGMPDDFVPESPFTDLKVGEWIMLCGPHPDSTESNPRFVLNWYRVLAIDGKDMKLDVYGKPINSANEPERRLVSLRGPQWPWMPDSPPYSLSNYLCAGIFPGTVAVHNRTIQLESSSAFGGSGGGGGASAVTPSKYVPY